MNPENLNELISKARPNIKESTIKMYIGNLNKLKKIFEVDDFKFLKSPDKVAEKLSDKHYTTQRNYYNSIIILLMSMNALDNGDGKYKDILDKYNTIRDELNKKYIDDNASGVVSVKQSKNLISYEELQGLINEIKNVLDIPKLKKAESITAKESKLLMTFVILSILIQTPMRNDLSNMLIISKKAYNSLTDDDKKEHNYLLVEKSSLQFVLNDYKTSKKYLEKKLAISKDVEKTIRMYMRLNGMKNGDVLFPISRNGISQLLIKTSKKYIQKSISTTMIRKIVASHLLADVKEAEKKLAHKMGTDISTIKSVYVKTKD
tara:strand:+ start:881 stop:1837 length:957 start_codon:yes stop_codon:yes gene_type:complete